MHIVGTAGHVDHGKSSLVAALTGTNPDRWIEEQLRGMTLDLGFAHLHLADGSEAGIVDVPGHARFLHNMLAGAAGMEVLLLVVAADDGVMPQTIEHLQILHYLNVRRTLIALTKIDLIPSDQREAAAGRVRAALQGTLAADAPLVAVSTLRGEGLPELLDALARELAQIGPRDPDAPAYLPVDRAFVLAGRGTIVTGTLMQGSVGAGETVRLEPLGRDVRVRSLQVFGAPRERASAGSRVALNLAGVDRADIARGAVVTASKSGARSEFEVTFSPVDDAARSLLRRRTHVRAHIGSAEVLGTLVFASLPDAQEAVQARLFLREPVFAFPGIRFVVRRISPKTLLGGGEIAGASTEAATTDTDAGAYDQSIRAFLESRDLDPADVAAVTFAVNVREEIAHERLVALTQRGDAFAVARPLGYVAAAQFAAFSARVAAALDDMHQREPWAMGLTSIALARQLGIPEGTLVRLLAALIEDGRIAGRHGYYAATGHTAKLSAEQRSFFEGLVPFDPGQPFVPAVYDDVAAAVKRSPIAGIAKAFETLLARGVLVKVGEALYRGSQIERAHELVDAFIAQSGSMTMAQFRDLLGTSRKYAVPLLEWFDARAITVRSGDVRMLRARKGAREGVV